MASSGLHTTPKPAEPAKKKKKNPCFPYDSCGQFAQVFWDNLWENDIDEKFLRVQKIDRAFKVITVFFLIIKPIILIALSQIPPRATVLQSVIIFCAMGCVAHMLGFAGIHFKIMKVSLLFFIMDLILAASELAVLISVNVALPASDFSGLLSFYISLFAINLVTLALALAQFIILHKQEVEEEKREQEEKERQEAAEEEARVAAAKEMRRQRREQRRADREMRLAASMASPASADSSPALSDNAAGALLPALPKLVSGGKSRNPDPRPSELSPHPHATSDDL